MSNWTREHDAHIARECEGLEVITSREAMLRAGISESMVESIVEAYAKLGYGDEWALQNGLYDSIPNYSTDANARDRAAEAWRVKKQARWIQILSAAIGVGCGELAQTAQCIEGWKAVGKHSGENALLWALYRATGGVD